MNTLTPTEGVVVEPTGHEAVDELLIDAATRGERILSMARGVFCLLILLRSVLIHDSTELLGGKGAVTFSLGAIALLFSAFMVWGPLRWRRKRPLHTFSVLIDAMACFGLLATNVLWPHPEYRGLLFTPDISALIIVAMAAGLRLSLLAAFTGGAASLLSLVILAYLDHIISGVVVASRTHQYVLFGLFLAGACALAVIVTRRTRSLVIDGATQALTAARARGRLGAVLADHHDVRTVLSSANLNAERLAKTLAAKPFSRGRREREAARQVADELRQVSLMITQFRDRTFEELSALQKLEPVDAARVAERVIAALRARFPACEFTVRNPDKSPVVALAGGESTLERILNNLFVNACEGDGRTGASRIEICFEYLSTRGTSAPARWMLLVKDDGPGFSAPALAAPIGAGRTTKPEGLGLGLFLVQGLVGANGGTLERRNREQGGARVELCLPAANVIDEC